jgi:hypothetical protein
LVRNMVELCGALQREAVAARDGTGVPWARAADETGWDHQDCELGLEEGHLQNLVALLLAA